MSRRTQLISDKSISESLKELFSTWNQWQQCRHVDCAELPRRTNCVTYWNNPQLHNNRLGVIKWTVKSYPAEILTFGLTFPQLRNVFVFCRHRKVAMPVAHMSKQNRQPVISKQPNLTFRFSRFRTFFSTIVRHCFSVVSLASEAITLSCCVTQSDGISNKNNPQPCASQSHSALPAPRRPDADGTVSFVVIVPPNPIQWV